MTIHKRAVTKFQTLVEDLPELRFVSTRRERNVYKVNGYDALIESAVIFRLSVFIHVGREKASATHTGITMPFAVFIYLIFKHFLLGNIIGHHALCRTLRRKLGEIPIFLIFRNVVGL